MHPGFAQNVSEAALSALRPAYRDGKGASINGSCDYERLSVGRYNRAPEQQLWVPDVTMTCKGAAAFPEKCSVWSSGLAPRDPTQDLPEWLGCVGCGESKTETEQVVGTQPCTEKEQVWQMKPQNTARMGRQPG